MSILVEMEDSGTDPQLNLKLEQELIRYYSPKHVVLRFWKNTPCLVLGRFQRLDYEISAEAKNSSIPKLHRQSGGGTVYHDLGNLNISLVASKEVLGKLGNEKGSFYFTKMIADALRKLGLDIRHQENRNALFIGEQKILGSAAHVSGDILHYHASLLVCSDLDLLQRMIEWNPEYPEDERRLVKSVRSPVTRLVDHDSSMNMTKIEDKIRQTVADCFLLSEHQKRAWD